MGLVVFLKGKIEKQGILGGIPPLWVKKAGAGGERVRSKSEKIIADKLFSLGIPYRYEYPLVLDREITVFPDFTILRVDTRKEVYLEHFGMMDDQDYVGNVILKLNTYAKNKIYLGINLLFTYETGKQPLNIRALDEFLKEIFLNE